MILEKVIESMDSQERYGVENALVYLSQTGVWESMRQAHLHQLGLGNPEESTTSLMTVIRSVRIKREHLAELQRIGELFEERNK